MFTPRMPDSNRSREPDAPRAPCNRRASVDLTGRVLGGRYRLLRHLGHGGSGATIYEAEHVDVRRRVAVKVLDPGLSDADTIARFTQEARAAAALRSEHIIDIIELVCHDTNELVYMVMECLDGEDLAATLKHDGPLDWRRVLSIGTQVCEALVAAHASGVVHCDIKPGNCFRISHGGTDDFIKVLDFGVSCFSGGAATANGRPNSGPVIGTPGYMPQEQLRGGPYDHRVDIFALGVLMFRLLTNKMPYSGGSLFVPRRPASGPIPLRRAAPAVELPDDLETVILKSVASDPAERYQSAAELLDALLAIADTAVEHRLGRDPLAWGERPSAA
ncbi:serine/threonine-protein kinase [Nannocystis radixulma]|uniref:Serine/threonine-protein kinase n=1 Tax=Nannocystis radixulma TaxID=2995305 RepID=A0ABT5B3V8_9BACT|nr:serine/threonine-protein kinase [Nannocystis radixulma]MDC0668799.1 serine/threonine-protein kinase [Nannocystis radixulma]